MSIDAFGYCLNTSTIRGQGHDIAAAVELVAAAGYDAIEPWVKELDAYTDAGGNLEDLGRQIADAGIAAENLIGFFAWAVDDEATRQAALTEARRNLQMAQAIGCRRLAAPPMGLVDVDTVDYLKIARRYAELLAIADDYGVLPVLEFWGVSKSLGRLGEALLVATETGRRDACILADIYHMYKKGTPHDSLRLLGPDTLGLVHMNDYPADPPRAAITDADRVYPGDGVADLDRILQDLHDCGYSGMLSLELFNESYWAQDAETVLKVGLEKMQTAVVSALGE